MKSSFSILLFTFLASSLSFAAPKVRWPRDVVEWEKLKEVEETAKKEGLGYAFIFVPKTWQEDIDGGVGRSIEATNDAIAALKSFCVIVKGDYQAVVDAARGEKDSAPPALVAGLTAAGNTYPLVVVLDTGMQNVLGTTSGQKIHEEGKKIFRDAKKKHRELQKQSGEEEKDEE